MKKNIRKFWSLLVCLALLVSMSTMASATTTISWGDGTSARTLTMNSSNVNYEVCINPAGSYVHTYGTATEMSYFGSFTATATAEHSGDFTSFKTYVIQAMNKEGMMLTYSAYITAAQYTVRASAASGTYKLYARLYAKDASWNVTAGALGRAVTYPTSGSGTISHAPTGSYIITGKVG